MHHPPPLPLPGRTRSGTRKRHRVPHERGPSHHRRPVEPDAPLRLRQLPDVGHVHALGPFLSQGVKRVVTVPCVGDMYHLLRHLYGSAYSGQGAGSCKMHSACIHMRVLFAIIVMPYPPTHPHPRRLSISHPVAILWVGGVGGGGFVGTRVARNVKGAPRNDYGHLSSVLYIH